MLKSCAAFLDEQAQVLVFIRNGKFEVPILFSEQDIHSLKTKEIADLSSALEKGVHEKQRASIMAEAVCEMTVMLPPIRGSLVTQPRGRPEGPFREGVSAVCGRFFLREDTR